MASKNTSTGVLLLNSMLNEKTDETFARTVAPQFKAYQQNNQFSDVTIHVGGKSFPCHRVILASMSAYFARMFGGSFLEAQSSSVTLHGIDADIFQKLLDVMYAGPLPQINGDNVAELLHAAQYLHIEHVVNSCCDFLKRVMRQTAADTVNFPKILSFLRRTTARRDVIELVVKYIVLHLNVLTRMDSFVHTLPDDLLFIARRYRELEADSTPWTNEDFLLDALLRWVHHAYDDRKKHFGELLEIVDFQELSVEYVRLLANDYNVHVQTPQVDIPLMKTTIMESEARPSFPHQVRCGRKATIHMYKSTPKTMNPRQQRAEFDYQIFSMHEHKAEPEWFPSGSFSLSRRRVQRPLSMVSSEDTESLYCVTQGLNDFDGAKFAIYQETELVDGHPLTLGSPLCDFREPSLGVNGDRIYMYNPDVHAFDYARSVRSWDLKNFCVNEYKRGIYSYKCDIDTWFPVPEMKRKLAFAGLVTDSSRNLVYLVGGQDANGEAPQGFVQAYDNRAPEWFNLPASERSYADKVLCCQTGSKLFVTDGETGMEVFDQAAGRWSQETLPAMEDVPRNERVSEKWLVPLDGDLYFFHKRCSFVSVFDIHASTWSELISYEDEVFGGDDEHRFRAYGIQNVVVHKSFKPWNDQ